MERLKAKLEKIGRNPIITAKSVGLRYSINVNNGFYRMRKGEIFEFVDENKKKVRDKHILERINKLVIPPAWENVWISPYENGHLQATGIDAKGRKQYRYHAQWNKIRNQSKFYKLHSFANALPLIRKQVEIDLNKKGLPFEKVVALVVKLIELTNIRIGNDAYKNGELDRKYLAAIVFNNKEKLELLNSLTHPITIRDADEWMKQQTSLYVIKEAALLFESGAAEELDYVIGVYAPQHIRIQRVIKRDKMPVEEIMKRISRQIDEEMKMKLCNFTITNNDHHLVIPQIIELDKKFRELSLAV